MKDYLGTLLRGVAPMHARNVVREYLQARILQELQRAGGMAPLAFQGGTALRFLYQLPRFSEDLDFALEGSPDSYALRRWLIAMARQFDREGYSVRVSVRERRAVHAGWIRFDGLLAELGLSPHHDEALGIKIDVDTRPPAGAVTETHLVRRHRISLRLHHHDRASLLAGKVHAVLQRPWIKGRDIYDLTWYLSDPSWPAPNLAMLNAALRQTDCVPAHPALTPDTWRGAIVERVAAIPTSWAEVVTDVRPFLERGDDAFSRDEVMAVLEGHRRVG